MKSEKLHLLTNLFLAENEAQPAKESMLYWGRRMTLQLRFAADLVQEGICQETDLVANAIDVAAKIWHKEQAIGPQACREVERMLSPLASKSKEFVFFCVGHAHIDMNWMWSYDETVTITLETFRTVLRLMEEYPDFTYAQSQASVYQIVQEHDPQMLEAIKTRIHEGRWEVTASTWVEADRNMPSAESMVRQLLYTRSYLSKTLGIDPQSLDLDYEPDTFGHHENVPEILADAGVRYYYHCRGHDDKVLYRWQAPSGKEVLVFREPLWYNWGMMGEEALHLLEFCRLHDLKSMLRVYGVGDHGGGPTRKDIEQIMDMNQWPVFPSYRFGTYHDFFREVEKGRDRLPLVQGELNFVFDGCYTSQSSIKKGNRHGEVLAFRSEAAAALARHLVGSDYRRPLHEKAWRHMLFNQFHDILPGSGTAETRNHALGSYQEAFAIHRSQAVHHLRALDARIDSKKFMIPQDIRDSRSEGAGVGFPSGSNDLDRTGRHAGKRRLFTVYNPVPWPRDELCHLTAWDWPGDNEAMQFINDRGQVLPHQILEVGEEPYWGHLYCNVAVKLSVPALGYTTIVLDEKVEELSPAKPIDPRVDRPMDTVLENEKIRVRISPQHGHVISMIEKENGQELIDPDHPVGVFQQIEEDPEMGMTSWRVGRYRQSTTITQGIEDLKKESGPLRQCVTWRKSFGQGSMLKVRISLDKGRNTVVWDIDGTWQELGSREKGVPQLSFIGPRTVDPARFAVPMGETKRKPHAHDVPATGYAIATGKSGRELCLYCDSKYGYRQDSSGLSLTLIRSSYDPDPWPEIGKHAIRIGLGILAEDSKPAMLKEFMDQPLQAMASEAKKGTLPTTSSLVENFSKELVVSAIKLAEDDDDLILRLYNVSDETVTAKLKLFSQPQEAWFTNLHEEAKNSMDPPVLCDSAIQYLHPPQALITLRVRL